MHHPQATGLYISIKRLKELQQYINFRWVQYGCRVVCYEVIDYLAERRVQQSANHLPINFFFRFAEFGLNRNIQAGPSGYYANESRQETWNKIFDNRNIISYFLRGDAVAICLLTTDHDCIQIASLSASSMSCAKDITP
jgi:hypothetical protein